MNTKTIASIGIIVVAVAAAVGLGIWHKKNPGVGEAPGKVVETPSESKYLVTKEPKMVPVGEESFLLGVGGSYPQFAQADASFNAKITKTFTDEIANFKKTVNDDYEARLETGGDEFTEQFSGSGMYTYEIETSVVQSNDNYISVAIHYGGYSGGAHGSNNVMTFNYDVKNQKEIVLTDLVTLKEASERSRKQLYENVMTDDGVDPALASMISDGTDPDKSENFQNFTFIPNLLTIYFNPYQVAPYVFGEQKVVFSL
jgi:hypothetical protein